MHERISIASICWSVFAVQSDNEFWHLVLFNQFYESQAYENHEIFIQSLQMIHSFNDFLLDWAVLAPL